MSSERPERNLKLTVEYDGTGFHGWQVQPGVRTVQGTLIDAIRNLTGDDVDLPGASRTDSGVHAFGQVAHLLTRSPIPTGRLPAALNGRLPPEVRVRRVEDVPETFHARFSAVGKRYRYLIDRAPVSGVFISRRAFHFPVALDVAGMREAASHLEGEHDFAAFRSNSGRGEREEIPTVRTVHRIRVLEDGALLQLLVIGRSFLYKMVRTLAGTLLEVGRGHWAPDRVREALASRDRRLAGPTLPPAGLCLEEVYYEPADLARDATTREGSASDRPGEPSKPFLEPMF